MGFPISSDIFGQLKWLIKQVKLLQANVIRSVKTFSPSVTASAGAAQGTIISPTLNAAANGDVLVGLNISPTFSSGAFTNVTSYALRINGVVASISQLNFNTVNGNSITFQINSSEKVRISPSGNLLLNSTTDMLAADKLQVNGNISLTTVGNKIKIATGSNASAGTVTLSGGATTTVSTTAVTATSIILLTTQSVEGTAGFLVVSAKSTGVSFTITSSTGVADTSVVGWIIIN
jgi:hypothetical protein